jgi:hypothetical protein
MNRAMAVLALAALAGFLAILAWKVARVDLSVVIAVTFALAAWDVLRSAFRNGR